MGELFVRALTKADQLWICDNCGQEGVRANGKDIRDNTNEVVMWFCYNCLESVRL